MVKFAENPQTSLEPAVEAQLRETLKGILTLREEHAHVHLKDPVKHEVKLVEMQGKIGLAAAQCRRLVDPNKAFARRDVARVLVEFGKVSAYDAIYVVGRMP